MRIVRALVEDTLPLPPIEAEVMRNLVDLMEHTDTMIFVFDADDRIRVANAALRKALHIEVGESPTWAEIMRRNFHLNRGARVATTDFEAWLTSTISRRGKTPHRSLEVDLCDGRWLAMTETMLSNGWMLCTAIDVTHLSTSKRDLRLDRDQAQKAANTDELTGISNRRHVMAQLDQIRLGQSMQGSGNGFACLLDIDHFKRVNDTYGHQVGDTVLIAMARCIRATIRTADCFGRVGGEEFLLLLETNDDAKALAIIDRVFTDVRALQPLPNDPGFKVTISAGLSRIDRARPVDATYSACDAALYLAKEQGRDRLVTDI